MLDIGEFALRRAYVMCVRTSRSRHADLAVLVDRCRKPCDADAAEQTPKPSAALGGFEGSPLLGFDGGRVMKLSRGIALAFGLAALALGTTVAPAFADSPVHAVDEFSAEESLPAGTFCDFNYVLTFTVKFNAIIFGGPADPSRSIEHVGFTITHTNLDTEYALTEKGIITIQISAEDARQKEVGVPWHLRDPNGKLVVQQAGQLLIDTDTGEILKFTANLTPGSAEVICPALGGAPAP
jgi:hypothetical protein